MTPAPSIPPAGPGAASGPLRTSGGYRRRLALAFAAVVAVALGIVIATLPRLVDDYLRTQERDALAARAEAVAELIGTQIRTVTTTGQDYQRPVLMETADPPGPSDSLISALGTGDRGFLADLTRRIAAADIVVEVYTSPGDRADGDSPVYRVDAALPADAAVPGQTRERVSATTTVLVPDRYWTQFVGGTRRRPVTVTLRDPWSARAETMATVGRILAAATIAGLIAAGLVALLLTTWLADPVRRLIRAARQLEDGRLDVRVALPTSAAPEVRELGDAFNQMAARLGESMERIRADRDRSRDFVADVSHELRTPIAALRTFNELLQTGAAEDPVTRDEFLEQSGRQIERLDWLAVNLLELSKLDSGLVSLDPRPEDLRGVVEAAVQQAEPVAGRKGVDLRMALPAEPVRQPHDPPRLGQVLGNLIGNAIKFTPTGGLVEVALRPTLEGAVIEVRDTGIGIPPEEIPLLFERFWRGARSRERGSGSGLGLSIAKSIVDMHGGRIAVRSTAGEGSTFEVILPARVPPIAPKPKG